MKKRIDIKFVDFWDGFRAEDFFLYRLLQEQYEVVLSDKPGYIVFSVFGNEHLRYDRCVKLFWTGECQTPDFNYCDYAIGFDRMEFGDRYLRYPLYYTYRNDYALMLHKHEDANLQSKDAFCSFVYSNANASAERGRFFDLLSAYKPVCSGGRYRNNIGSPVADKLAFQQRHKFAIAFENASYEGYTTEKLLQAFAAGTVPIYWGDPSVVKDFNPDSFINCMAYPSLEAVVARVREVDEDDTLYLNMLHTPALTDMQAKDKADAALTAFVCHIFDQDQAVAMRFPRAYWAQKQLKLRLREKKSFERSLYGMASRFYKRYLFAASRKSAKGWALTQRLMRLFGVQ